MFPISDDNPTRHGRPYVNIALIAISTLVFFWELGLNSLQETQFFFRYGVIPKELTGGLSFECLGRAGTGIIPLTSEQCARFSSPVEISTPIASWLTLFTSMFIHGGFLHWAGNMIFLWVFGDNVEDRLGHARYLLFYLATGVAASWAQIAINMDSLTPTIGASGATAGVLGAYLLLYPFAQVRTIVIFFLIAPLRIRALYLLGFWLLLQFFSGVGSLGTDLTSGVAYWAHIGGFVAGMIVIAFLKLLVWREPLWPGRPGPALGRRDNFDEDFWNRRL